MSEETFEDVIDATLLAEVDGEESLDPESTGESKMSKPIDVSPMATLEPESGTAAPTTGRTTVMHKIMLPDNAQSVLDEIATQTGMREDEIVKRIFNWVMDQNEIVRGVVLGQIPEALRPNVWKLIAESAA